MTLTTVRSHEGYTMLLDNVVFDGRTQRVEFRIDDDASGTLITMFTLVQPTAEGFVLTLHTGGDHTRWGHRFVEASSITLIQILNFTDRMLEDIGNYSG